MSIRVPHEQMPYSEPSWVFIHSDSSLPMTSVSNGRWWTHASLTDIDGIRAFQTVEALETLICLMSGHAPVTLHPPTPRPFFALSRMRVPLSTVPNAEETPEPLWMFTCVGYLTLDLRVYLTILPDHLEFHTEARDTEFSFA